MLTESEHKAPQPHGRLDKFTAVQELQSKGLPVPPVFSTTEEATEWQASGGTVFARPYFKAPWDSAIFLPGLNSHPIDDLSSLDYFQHQWDGYIQELSANQNLLGYLKQFGVDLNKSPEVSYFLQACVSRGFALGQPTRSNIIAMNNGDHTHLEWQTSGFPAHSGVYKGFDHVMLGSFFGFPYTDTDNGQLDSRTVLDLFQKVKGAFKNDKNLQVEMAYGQLKSGDKPELYTVQVRDFPQMHDTLWEYGESYGLNQDSNRGKMYSMNKGFASENISSIYDTDWFQDDPYVLKIDYNGIDDEDLLKTYKGMKGLWLQDKWSRVPLMHGLFSLIELAHIKGGKVLLG